MELRLQCRVQDDDFGSKNRIFNILPKSMKRVQKNERDTYNITIEN